MTSMSSAGVATWLSKPIRAVLSDVHGVIFDNGKDGPCAIERSVAAFNRLKQSEIPVRLVSNESSVSPAVLYERCKQLGLNIELDEILTPIKVVRTIVENCHLRPYLLLTREAQEVFASFAPADAEDCDSVVVADAEHDFTYDKLNHAFRLLISGRAKRFIALGNNRYYRSTDGYFLDVGAFKAALEFSSGRQAEVVGKPSPLFFQMALQELAVPPEHVVMIGDDIQGDVGGAQQVGMRGVLVKTGKFMEQDLRHPTVTPDGLVDDLHEAVDLILSNYHTQN